MTRWFMLLALALTLVACGGGASSNTAANPSAGAGFLPAEQGVPLPDGNVIALLVDGGPDGAGVNRLYTSVTICKPGSATLCKTIDHVLGLIPTTSNQPVDYSTLCQLLRNINHEDDTEKALVSFRNRNLKDEKNRRHPLCRQQYMGRPTHQSCYSWMCAPKCIQHLATHKHF
jgi:hypothetical protein